MPYWVANASRSVATESWVNWPPSARTTSPPRPCAAKTVSKIAWARDAFAVYHWSNER